MKFLSKIKVSKSILIIQFILLATVFNALTVEGKNLLFMSFTFLGALCLLSINRRVPLNISSIVFLLLILLWVSYAVNFRTSEHLSFAYSFFFISSFIIFTSFFKQKISPITFRNLAFFVLITYLTVLIIGQFYVLLGYFKGTHITQGLTHGPFGTLFEAGRGFRFYSLSSEPSYAAFIVICLLYAILETDPHQKPFGRKNLYAWLITIYMLLSFQSGYGIILLFILVIMKTSMRNSIIIIIVGLLLIVGTLLVKQTALNRVLNIISNLEPGRIEDLATIDHSASFRVLPTYHYIRNIDIRDLHFYFGYGAGQSSEFLIPFLFNVKVDHYEGGFLPQFIYDYGIIFGLAFALFLMRESITKLISFETFVFVLMITNANFNTQLFWVVITIFSYNKFYKEGRAYSSPIPDLAKTSTA